MTPVDLLFGCLLVALCAGVAAAIVCALRGVTLERVAPRLHRWVSGAHNLPTPEAIAEVERREWRALLRDLERLRDRAMDEQRERHPRREAQRRSFIYGNTALSNPAVTPDLVDEVARSPRA